MLGRLELGDIENTDYYDPQRLCDVDITFRHATSGELAASIAKAGLDILDVDGNTEFRLKGESTTMGAVAAMSDADCHLAAMCIISARPIASEDPSDNIKADTLYRPALVAIGEYIREQSGASDEEKKP